MHTALRVLEGLLPPGGRLTALRNARTSALRDRGRARARREAAAAPEAAATRPRRPVGTT
ncbi:MULTISPECIES: hypothetical protein [Streptomyces]|uniref:Uncharacterized protein n=1 Tax=Streptomyces desertarenae TaxID=2666184 RepID=A0ABW4PGR4_9ACTN